MCLAIVIIMLFQGVVDIIQGVPKWTNLKEFMQTFPLLRVQVDFQIIMLYIHTYQMFTKDKVFRIVTDFDETLCRNGYVDISQGYQTYMTFRLLNYLKFWQEKGAYIILNTLRESSKLESALHWLETYGFYPDLSNANEVTGVATWGVDPRKIAGELFIDDKSCGTFGKLLRRGF